MSVIKSMKFPLSIFLFRRDLRLHDNHSLSTAAHQSERILPCFILDPRQVGRSNEYRSMSAVQFMSEALHDLHEQLHARKGRLYIFKGHPDTVLACLIKEVGAQAVFCSRDYTPFSRERDEALERLCTKSGIMFSALPDVLLQEPEAILTSSGTPYRTFTPFFQRARRMPVKVLSRVVRVIWYTKTIPATVALADLKGIVGEPNDALWVRGKRKDGLARLRSLDQLRNYAHDRNVPALPTTHLSAYLKFGLISIREVYQAIREKLGVGHPLLEQLYWRDFFSHTLFHAPSVLGSAGVEQYDGITWRTDKKQFHAWCEGKTGVPIIDAGMRQLNATGFMHNRVRMLTASFLVKDLLIDWRWGEQYFAQQLVDYDPAVNNGNWQWVASTGSCAQPYFRIFNPWLQQKKFDPECQYIKQWVYELQDASAAAIHALVKRTTPAGLAYPVPLVDHQQAARRALSAFKKAAVARK